MRPPSSETGIWVSGWELLLSPCLGGWNYEWQDQHGQVVCCGWTHAHSKDAAEHMARTRLAGERVWP